MVEKKYKVLTHKDISKLPPCKHDVYGRCQRFTDNEPTLKDCLMCTLDGQFTALRRGDIALATHMHDVLLKILDKLGVLPDSTKGRV